MPAMPGQAAPEEKEAAPERPLQLSVGKVAVPGVRSPGICLYVELALGIVLIELSRVTRLIKIPCPKSENRGKWEKKALDFIHDS